jgi:ornithine carbamoyltransferase
MKKDLLKISDLSRDGILSLVRRGRELKEMHRKGLSHTPLSGKTLSMIFQKSSTRTRVSFEVGMSQLGGHALFLSPRDTQIGRGEEIRDTARVLSGYVDGIMIRTYLQEEVEEFARSATVPVINGLTDLHHPCQVLGDLMTAAEEGKEITKMAVCFVGDGNNVANSWVEASFILGFELRVVCPSGYEPDSSLMSSEPGSSSVEIVRDPLKGVEGADILYTDVWTSMGQEEEKEAREEAFRGYTIDSLLLSRAGSGARVMHCLPAHRGKEITDDVLEGSQSSIFPQAENRLHIQKAILETLLK